MSRGYSEAVGVVWRELLLARPAFAAHIAAQAGNARRAGRPWVWWKHYRLKWERV